MRLALPIGYMAETPDSVSEFEVEAAWLEEIRRRLAEVDRAAVELVGTGSSGAFRSAR